MEVTLDLRPDLTAPATARAAVDRLAGALSPALAADCGCSFELVTNASCTARGTGR